MSNSIPAEKIRGLGGGSIFDSARKAEEDTKSASHPYIGIAKLSFPIKTNFYPYEEGKYYPWYAWNKEAYDNFLANPNFKDPDDSTNIDEENLREHTIKIWAMRIDGKDLPEPKLVWSKEGIKKKSSLGLRPIEDVIAEYEKERKRMRS